MGDTINLASRLEGAAKLYRVTILAGEETRARVNEAIVMREIDTIRVVGKAKPVSVYEIVGEKGEIAAAETEKLTLFERAREAYKRGDWDAAAGLFGRLEGDGAAELYLGRCRELKASPPPADWDGVFELTHK
jgi:adenylate cyclase